MMKPGMRIGTSAGAAASAGIRAVCTSVSTTTASSPMPRARANASGGTASAGTDCCSIVRCAPVMSSPNVSNVPAVGTMSAKLVAPPKSRVSMSSSTTSSSTGTSEGGVRIARRPSPPNRVPAAMKAHSHHQPLPEMSGPSAIVAMTRKRNDAAVRARRCMRESGRRSGRIRLPLTRAAARGFRSLRCSTSRRAPPGPSSRYPTTHRRSRRVAARG